MFQSIRKFLIERDRQAQSRLNQEHLKIALDAARMGTWEWNLATGAIQWSDGVEALFGLARGTFAGTFAAYLDLVHAQDRALVQQAIADAVAGVVQDYQVEHRVVLASGEIRWLEGKGKVYRDASSQAVGMAGTVTNITERKNSERSLRDSQARLDLIFNSTTDAFLLVAVEPDGDFRIASVNRAFVDLVRRTSALESEKQIVGKRAAEFFGEILPANPTAASAALNLFRQAVETRQSVFAEMRLGGREGMVILEQAVAPVLNSEGKCVHLLVTGRDITERRLAEKQIQQRLAELAAVNAISQALASQLDLPIILKIAAEKLLQIFDAQGIYISLYDDQSEVMRFPYWWSLGKELHLEPRPLRGGLSDTIFQSHQPLLINENYEQRFVELGGRRVTNAAHQYPKAWLGVPMIVRDEHIGVVSLQNFEHENAFSKADVHLLTTIAANMGVAIQNAQLFATAQQEIVERQKLIAVLEDKNAELERFTYTVSHDLKSPLITIRGFLGFLEEDAASGNLERLKADVERISKATQHMQRLLNELLELSRIGRLMNPPVAVAFDALAREAVELVRGRLDARGVHVDYAPNLSMVHGDRVRLIELLQNLIDNAAKFMGDQPAPRIEIGQRGVDDDGKPILFVRDNGMGIEPQYHERIFGLFNKLDAQSEGTGVGLALVKRIIEVHNGHIWVESEGLGKGATFCFTLPTEGPIQPQSSGEA